MPLNKIIITSRFKGKPKHKKKETTKREVRKSEKKKLMEVIVNIHRLN